MPAHGDQQRQASAIPNPFDEGIPRVSAYTAQEIATLQSRLDRQLGPEYISTRKGPGGSNVHYLAAEKVINLANEVFGFNGWSSTIRDVTIDYVDIEKDGRVSMGCSIITRVTLRDGIFHEDIGYGEIKNCNSKGAAFEKVKKEAATDGLKRALRNFGNVLGNCLYDKSYLQKVTKVKIAPSRWDVESLHRHPDYAPARKEIIEESSTEKDTSQPRRTSSEQSRVSITTTDYDDEYGGNLFEEVDFSRPDEVRLDATDIEATEIKMLDRPSDSPPGKARQPTRVHSMPQMRPPIVGQPPAINPNQPRQQGQRGGPAPNNNGTNRHIPAGGRMGPPQHQLDTNQPQRPLGQANQQPQQARPTSLTPEQALPNNQRQHQQQQNGQPVSAVPVGFITARAADKVEGPTVPSANIPPFNPHAESPSIRKTNGIDHNRSARINRQIVGAPVPPLNGQNVTVPTPNRSNFINPQADTNRRIGMPGGAQSPLTNRAAYKPPGPAGVKRAPDGGTRPALADVSNMLQVDGAGDLADVKRQKLLGN